MALELYHSPYRLTMYYQGLLSLIAPSQIMICGTMTLRYLFRIVLSGAVTKDTNFITSGLVTRQGGTTQPSPITFPVSFASKCLTVVPQLQAPGDTGNMSKNRVCVTNLTARGFALELPQSAYNYIAIGI